MLPLQKPHPFTISIWYGANMCIPDKIANSWKCENPMLIWYVFNKCGWLGCWLHADYRDVLTACRVSPETCWRHAESRSVLTASRVERRADSMTSPNRCWLHTESRDVLTACRIPISVDCMTIPETCWQQAESRDVLTLCRIQRRSVHAESRNVL